MKTTIFAVLLSLTLCAYAQSIQVSSCSSGETHNCYQCVASATADGTACGSCYGQCVNSNDTCPGTVPALNCTDTCAVIDATMYPNLNYYSLAQNSSYLASPYVSTLAGAGGPRAFFTYVKTYLSASAKTVDPFINWGDATCFDPANPGSFFSTADTTCDTILYVMRYNYHLTRCDGNVMACANSSHCNQIPDACAYVLNSGCLNSTIMNWCDMNDTMCNSEIEYQPLQQICGAAPSVLSCEGALTLGCNVCNSTTTGTVGTLTGTAQPVCSGTNIFIPNSDAGIQTCESAPSEMCHDIDPTVASALGLVYPSGFQTRTPTCYNAPTPAPQVVNNNTNVTVTCIDKAYSCDLSVDCREAFFQLQYYTQCKPCSASGTQQIKASQCAKLLACTPFMANCSTFGATASYYESTVLPALCAADENGLDFPPFRDIDALHAGCANAPPPTTSAVVTGSNTAVVTGAGTSGSQTTDASTSAGTTMAATNAGVTSTSGMASAGATTGGSTGMASTGAATGAGTTTGVMGTSAGTTSGSATTVRATTTASPPRATGDSTRNVFSFAVVLTILACVFAL